MPLRAALRRCLRRAGDEQGTAILEFALIAPAFLLIVIGMIAFGIYFAGLIAITNAAAEGARASVAGLSTGERQSLASTAASAAVASYAPFLKLSFATIATGQDSSDANRFRVSVAYDFSQFGLTGLVSFLGVGMQRPTMTVTVGNAGYY